MELMVKPFTLVLNGAKVRHYLTPLDSGIHIFGRHLQKSPSKPQCLDNKLTWLTDFCFGYPNVLMSEQKLPI